MENFQFRPEWDIVSIISEELNLSSDAVRNTVDMLEAEQTIPFIARYRKEKTANMEVAQLREVFRLLEELKIVIQKAEYVAKQVHAKGKLTPNLLRDLQRATTVCEIEQVFAPFKPASKKTLAERAKQSGLEPLALQFMKGTKLNFQKYIDPNVQGKETLENLKSGIKHIVAESISKDQETLCELRKMPIMGDTVFEVTPAKNPIKGSADTPRSKAKAISHEATSENYESYFNKKTYHMRDIQSFHVSSLIIQYLWSIQSCGVKCKEEINMGLCLMNKFKGHMTGKGGVFNGIAHKTPLIVVFRPVLAINRAETQKVMNVKVIFPEWVVRNFMKYLHRRWIPPAVSSEDYKFWEMILQDCYTRFLAPRLIREIRSDLTKKAEKASLDVFGENLKHLLMTPPVLGCTIMGIDPGFSHGCKIAIISETSEILQTGIVYLNLRKVCENKLIGYLKTHRCSTIAIGNGTACRETEVFVSDIVKKPEIAHLNCRYW
ncbi:S1 RNA-binding domain-containing protein 1 [Holothuria leucospilota]|uniref:S1 RNA-binding domain-containing protein 1 n=1 Tax=Holothuria leucospilota TaxID=206669 RepID=A0A9Q0YLP2_HOLLE|nr:S1 RNA-binding domain-containing protein 1 [Holothuria leucospilota]